MKWIRGSRGDKRTDPGGKLEMEPGVCADGWEGTGEGMGGLQDSPQGSSLNAVVVVVPCPLTGKTREEQVWESRVPVAIRRGLGQAEAGLGCRNPAFMVL